MEQKIFELLRQNKIGHEKANYLKHELLNLFWAALGSEKFYCRQKSIGRRDDTCSKQCDNCKLKIKV